MTDTSIKVELQELAPLIHQALLSPHINEQDLKEACQLARHYCFGGLCTTLNCLAKAREHLGAKGSTKLIAVIAFPFGAIPKELKIAESEYAAAQGAEEFDVVPNFSALSQGKHEIFAEEIASLCDLGLPTRIILDVNQLSSEKLKMAIEAAIDAGAYGLQTGNGFGKAATTEHVRQVKGITKGRCSIKAVGGIHTLPHALELINEGANLLGTSNGHELIKAFHHGNR